MVHEFFRTMPLLYMMIEDEDGWEYEKDYVSKGAVFILSAVVFPITALLYLIGRFIERFIEGKKLNEEKEEDDDKGY